MWNGLRLKPPAILSLALVFPITLAGCGILDGGETPKNARVIIEGEGSEGAELITSNDFVIVLSEDGTSRSIEFNSKETESVSPGFDQRYSLGPAVRFYASLSSETILAQSITMKIFVGGERRYISSSELGPDQQMEFVYTYR